MCVVCKKAVRKIPQAELLALVAAEMKKGVDPEHLDKVLGKVLGMEMKQEDAELVGTWEREQREKS